MKLGWPQDVWLLLTVFNLGMELARHGEPKEGTHNVWTTIFATMVEFAILVAGGFF